jgi:hypothetical protein
MPSYYAIPEDFIYKENEFSKSSSLEHSGMNDYIEESSSDSSI